MLTDVPCKKNTVNINKTSKSPLAKAAIKEIKGRICAGNAVFFIKFEFLINDAELPESASPKICQITNAQINQDKKGTPLEGFILKPTEKISQYIKTITMG